MLIEISEKGLVFLLTFLVIVSIISGGLIDVYTNLVWIGNIFFFVAGILTMLLAEVVNEDEEEDFDELGRM